MLARPRRKSHVGHVKHIGQVRHIGNLRLESTQARKKQRVLGRVRHEGT